MGVRTDYTFKNSQRFVRRCGDPDQVRRLLAAALILDVGSRSDAAKVASVTLQIMRDRVLRFNADDPDGQTTRMAVGRAPTLNKKQRALSKGFAARLAQIRKGLPQGTPI